MPLDNKRGNYPHKFHWDDISLPYNRKSYPLNLREKTYLINSEAVRLSKSELFAIVFPSEM